jgi:predicted metal-dependent phosphoesterase TrpH
MEETIGLVREQGGLCILPHPFSHTGFIGRSLRYREATARAHALQIDGVEVFNGAMLVSTCNLHSPQLARRLNKPALAGSDAHVRQAVGSCATLFPGRSATDLRAAIEQAVVMPAGRFWSPYAFLLTGFKWGLKRQNRLPVPQISVPAWSSQRRASVD